MGPLKTGRAGLFYNSYRNSGRHLGRVRKEEKEARLGLYYIYTINPKTSHRMFRRSRTVICKNKRNKKGRDASQIAQVRILKERQGTTVHQSETRERTPRSQTRDIELRRNCPPRKNLSLIKVKIVSGTGERTRERSDLLETRSLLDFLPIGGGWWKWGLVSYRYPVSMLRLGEKVKPLYRQIFNQTVFPAGNPRDTEACLKFQAKSFQTSPHILDGKGEQSSRQSDTASRGHGIRYSQ